MHLTVAAQAVQVVSRLPDQPPKGAAWEWLRTEKEGDGSPKTLEYYRYQVMPFLELPAREHPEVLDCPELRADHLRSYRAWLSKRVKRNGERRLALGDDHHCMVNQPVEHVCDRGYRRVLVTAWPAQADKPPSW